MGAVGAVGVPGIPEWSNVTAYFLLVEWFDLQKHVGESHYRLSVFQVQINLLCFDQFQNFYLHFCGSAGSAGPDRSTSKSVSTVRKVHPADLSRSDGFLHQQCCRQCRTAICRRVVLLAIVTAARRLWIWALWHVYILWSHISRDTSSYVQHVCRTFYCNIFSVA